MGQKEIFLYELYVRLYIFADQTDILALRREVKNYLVSPYRMMAFYNMIAHIHTSLPESSPLR